MYACLHEYAHGCRLLVSVTCVCLLACIYCIDPCVQIPNVYVYACLLAYAHVCSWEVWPEVFTLKNRMALYTSAIPTLASPPSTSQHPLLWRSYSTLAESSVTLKWWTPWKHWPFFPGLHSSLPSLYPFTHPSIPSSPSSPSAMQMRQRRMERLRWGDFSRLHRGWDLPVSPHLLPFLGVRWGVGVTGGGVQSRD